MFISARHGAHNVDAMKGGTVWQVTLGQARQTVRRTISFPFSHVIASSVVVTAVAGISHSARFSPPPSDATCCDELARQALVIVAGIAHSARLNFPAAGWMVLLFSGF